MNAGVIEGLVGAHTNIRIVDVPIMQVYHEAERDENYSRMEKAGEYATKFTQRAYKYKNIAEDQLKKEMEENRKNEETQREENLKKQKEETQEFYKTLKEKQAEKAKAASGWSMDVKMRNNQSTKTSATTKSSTTTKTSLIKKIEPTETKAYGESGQAVTAVPKKPTFAMTI